MKLHSNCLSKPKMKAFLKIYPYLVAEYHGRDFEVYDAIKYINRHPESGVWCYRDGACDQRVKTEKESKGLVSLNLQNACHCFAGRFESRVVNKTDGGKTVQLLDATGTKMTYRIRPEVTPPLPEDLE